MNQATTQLAIQDYLKQAGACVTLVQQALDREQAALRDRKTSTEDIQAAVEHKLAQMIELEQVEKVRIATLEQAGYASDRDGMNACLDWCDPRGTLKQNWNELLEQVRECQHSNQRNGGIADTSRRHIQRTLEILRGQVNEAPVYQPGKGSAPMPSGRILGKA